MKRTLVRRNTHPLLTHEVARQCGYDLAHDFKSGWRLYGPYPTEEAAQEAYRTLPARDKLIEDGRPLSGEPIWILHALDANY